MRGNKTFVWRESSSLPGQKGLFPGLPYTGAANSFTFADLFAGIGGLRIPFEEIGGRCVFTAEKDGFSRQTYEANFPDKGQDHKFVCDLRTFMDGEKQESPNCDVVLAGFPCQPFSTTGVTIKRYLSRADGFSEKESGNLFFYLARFIEQSKPSAFLLENVPGLVNHNGGETFRTIMGALTDDLGYSVKCGIIDACSWVPQNRKRVFFVGFRKPTMFSFDDVDIPRGEGPTLRTILDSKVDPKYTLSEKMWKYLKDRKGVNQRHGRGFGYSICGPNEVSRTLMAQYYKDGSSILIRQAGKTPRRLTPRECCRLMGFDEPGDSMFQIPVSDTQAYRQFGNSVVVPVVRAIARAMSPYMCPA